MNKTSENLLLAEYSRLVGLEIYRLEQYEQSLQLYFTTLGLVTGALLFLIEKGTPLNLPYYSILLLIGTLLTIGEVTFIRQIGTDILLRQNAQAFKLIREKLIENDDNTKAVFLKGIIQDKDKLESFFSFKGIVQRALTKTQQKTVIVLLNSVVATILLSQLVIWNVSLYFWIIAIIAIMAFIIIGGLHALYASWRYRQSEKEFKSGELNYWI